MALSRPKSILIVAAAAALFAVVFGTTYWLFHRPPARLVITKAVYGDLPAGASEDVTDILAGMIDHDSLIVDATNDMFGGDPAPNLPKKLRVEYTFDGVAATKTIGENGTLRIPTSTSPSRLVIKKAVYGDLKKGATVDVTEQLTDHIDGDALRVPAGNALAGDPAFGVVKQLQVIYTFDGAEKSVTVDEGETLTIIDGNSTKQRDLPPADLIPADTHPAPATTP